MGEFYFQLWLMGFKLNPLYKVNPKTAFAISENLYEMPHHEAFYQGLHCLLGEKDKTSLGTVFRD